MLLGEGVDDRVNIVCIIISCCGGVRYRTFMPFNVSVASRIGDLNSMQVAGYEVMCCTFPLFACVDTPVFLFSRPERGLSHPKIDEVK